MTLLLHSRCPKPLQFGDRNPALLCTDITNAGSEKNIQFGLFTNLEQVVTHRNAILFQLVYSSVVTDQSVFCCISNCSWNYKPSGNFEHDFSLSVISYEKTWPHIAASNYLYLFVWASFCILLILFFKHSFCNGQETELKCNTGFRENIYNWHFIIYGQLVLSPF